MSILDHSEPSDRELETDSELQNLKKKLREYLRLGSCDGRVERKDLRMQLARMISAEYDEDEARIRH